MRHDLVTLGEAMLRLWVRPGERLESTPRLRVAAAGAEANVAIAVARMGHSAAWLSRLPRFPLGRRVAREIASHGVDVSGVLWMEGSRLGTYYVELAAPPSPIRVIYDRAGSTAAGMTLEDVPWNVVESARLVHLTGITPALSPSLAEVSLEVARRARAASVPVSVDVNYRSSLWDAEEARKALTDLCSEASLVILAEPDGQEVFQLSADPRRAAAETQELFGAEFVVLTRGGRGAVWRLGDQEGETPALEAQVVDRIGVGDAFAAGVLVGFLEDDIRRGIEYGCAMAALKLVTEGDQFWGDRQEVEQLLARSDLDVRR